MRYRGVTIFALAVLASPSLANAKDKQPEMSPLAIQAMQTRDFEGAKEELFGSVMSVLQDAGYRIESGELQTGLITGVGSTTGKTTFNLFWGFGKKKKTPIVSAFIEQFGKTTRVRLNFVMATLKSNIYGSRPQDEEPVLDPAVYTDAFEKIDQALFVRRSMASSAESDLPAANAQDTQSQNQ